MWVAMAWAESSRAARYSDRQVLREVTGAADALLAALTMMSAAVQMQDLQKVEVVATVAATAVAAQQLQQQQEQ
jgi:hypothetical protein